MSFILDASGMLLLLSGLAAFIYEMWAIFLDPKQRTISAIVQKWTSANKPVASLVVIAVITGLLTLGIHFLGVL